MPQDWIEGKAIYRYSRLGVFWQLPIGDSLTTYTFAQMENLTLAIVKTYRWDKWRGNELFGNWGKGWMNRLAALPNASQQSQNDIDSHPSSAKRLWLSCKHCAHNFKQAQQHAQTLLILINHLQLSASVLSLAELSCHHEQQYSRLFRS